ncbi:SusC/RagA family TonB-linked outer membrane protein [Lutibacter sp.]|uniref:SusC/RagA family TonB-linked outer membrane protein n=1 Tax=Lutibacter sp. TaxID=1925666 RepID=UPI0035675DCF
MKSIILTIFLSFLGIIASAQSFEVKGTVVDSNGAPLPGVSIVVKNTTKGATTDFDGNFTISVQKGKSIVLSYLGYESKEIVINSENSLMVTLSESLQNLDEVVVTALGIKRSEKALGYAVQKVDGNELQKVSVVNVATSLTGKVAGLLVQNSSDFGVAPTLTIRGEAPILVIDGISYDNKTLGDISSEDIESVSVLKGATASALYGYRGANGAILVTTKNGSTNGGVGITTNFATNTMFTSGFLAIPERQGIYGRGSNGTYDINSSSSWGPVMDGTIRTQWDPFLKDYRDYEYLPIGKNNFSNFLEQGYITNNNLNIGYRGELLSLRSSVNWIQNKGQYPNSTLDKFTYTFGGDVNLDKFKLSSNFSYARQHTPNLGSNGYTSYDAMYSLLIWSAADYNVLDYKDNYWLVPDQVQNFTYKSGSNNPYFDRYERTNETSRDIFNVDVSASYQLVDWLKATLRAGYDSYTDKGELRISVGSYQSSGNTSIPGNSYPWIGGTTGAYGIGMDSGHSFNTDFLLTGDRAINEKIKVEYLVGGSIFSKEDNNFYANTNNGLTVPGFYSLAASKDPATVKTSVIGQQVNSVFGRLAASYNNLIYLEATGRNDWASTLQIKNKDNSIYYFYPSVSTSFVVSELLPETTKNWLDLLKLRNSWTVSKGIPDPYYVNSSFTTSSAIWGSGYNSGTPPRALYDAESIDPETSTTIEYGIQTMFFKNRFGFDVSYYEKETEDYINYASISSSSGYSSTLINTDEKKERRGWEISLTGTPIKTENVRWDIGANWSTYATYWTQIDDTYTTKNPWNKVGERVDNYLIKDNQLDPDGNHIIGSNGKEVFNSFETRFGYTNPDYLWGINSNLKYKDFNLFISVDGVHGGIATTRTESYMYASGGHPDSVTPERALDVATPGSKNWLSEGVQVVSGTVTYSDSYGTVLSDTRVYAPNTTYTTYKDYITNVHSGSAWGGTGRPLDAYEKTYFKIREISLTYTFPAEYLKGWAKAASISMVGQNVFLWAKDFKYSDPDGGTEDFADPAVRYLGGNIKLTF